MRGFPKPTITTIEVSNQFTIGRRPSIRLIVFFRFLLPREFKMAA